MDEIDSSSKGAQIELHSYFDRLPGTTAFLATCNAELKALDEPFRTRLQQFRFDPVDRGILADWLARYWELPAVTAAQIAQSVSGNVKDALLQAETILDRMALAKG